MKNNFHGVVNSEVGVLIEYFKLFQRIYTQDAVSIWPVFTHKHYSTLPFYFPNFYLEFYELTKYLVYFISYTHIIIYL